MKSSRQNQPLLQSFQIDHEEIMTTNDDNTTPSIIDNGGGDGSLLLRIGKRIGSGAYGTVHTAQFVNSENNKQYIAKRAWTLAELELDVPKAVMQLDRYSCNQQKTGIARLVGGATGVVEGGSSSDDNGDSKDKLKESAERCRYYWNVERHICQKLSSSSKSFHRNLNIKVTPQFMGVFQSAVVVDDDDDDGEEEEIVPGYGKIIGKHDTNNNNNEQFGGEFFSMKYKNNSGDDDNEGHDWMVFEYIPSFSCSIGGDDDDDSPATTLLDAMEVSL